MPLYKICISEFDTSPPAREWCPQLIPWWGACVGQAGRHFVLKPNKFRKERGH
jgi:hypothetical protein